MPGSTTLEDNFFCSLAVSRYLRRQGDVVIFCRPSNEDAPVAGLEIQHGRVIPSVAREVFKDIFLW
ncbi:MAG: hypothetical protein NVSMB6_02850 [Burkholderiaceae bacterium]